MVNGVLYFGKGNEFPAIPKMYLIRITVGSDLTGGNEAEQERNTAFDMFPTIFCRMSRCDMLVDHLIRELNLQEFILISIVVRHQILK